MTMVTTAQLEEEVFNEQMVVSCLNNYFSNIFFFSMSFNGVKKNKKNERFSIIILLHEEDHKESVFFRIRIKIIYYFRLQPCSYAEETAAR